MTMLIPTNSAQYLRRMAKEINERVNQTGGVYSKGRRFVEAKFAKGRLMCRRLGEDRFEDLTADADHFVDASCRDVAASREVAHG